MFDLFPQNSAYKKFWNWFEKNENRLFNFEKEQIIIFNELKTQLNIIDSNLTFELSSIQDGKREFVISADGLKKSFASVEKLYNEAPGLNKWIITKFRPRREKLYSIDYGGIKVNPDDVAFALVPNNNKVDIILYIKNYDETDKNIYGAIVFLLLDSALGEYDVETKIGRIDMNPSKEMINFNENNIQFLSKRFDEVFQELNKMPG